MTTSTNQYLKNQIETASPEQILIMLYDGAIRFIRRAMVGIENNDMTELRVGVNKTLAIIIEFSSSLDHKIGGQIAEDLDALYAFMIRELNSVTISPEMAKLESVEKLLVDLRATWKEAVEINRKQQHAQAATGMPQATGTHGSTYPSAVPTPPRGGANPYANTDNGLPQSYTPISISR